MSQSFAKLSTHLIFSTKHRQPFITPEITGQLYPYMAKIFSTCDSSAILIGGQPDHMHVLFLLSRKWALATLVERVKYSTSRWIKGKGAQFRNFHWQNGYGAFSISESGIAQTKVYIQGQEQHHRRTSFKADYRLFLPKYNIEYDERYVWD